MYKFVFLRNSKSFPRVNTIVSKIKIKYLRFKYKLLKFKSITLIVLLLLLINKIQKLLLFYHNKIKDF